MNEYFTLETVRDQLFKLGALNVTFPGGAFPEDWQYCPCIIVEKCMQVNKLTCPTPVYISVYIRTPNISIPIIVEIIYERNRKKGFIRANNMKLNELIERKLINKNALKIVKKPY